MKRSLFLLVAAVVLVLSACGDLATPYAAKVNGTRITQNDLDEELELLLDNEALMQQLEAGLQPGESVRGKGKGTVSSSFAAQRLTRRIVLLVIHQEVERRKLRITDELMAEAQQAAEQDGEIFEDLPADYQRDLVRANAEVLALQRATAGEVTDAEVAAFYEANPSEFKGRCISHILVDTKEAADALRAEVAGGGSFAELARAQSRDTNSGELGGFLGCYPEGEPLQFVEPFKTEAEKLPVGQLSQPVQTSFGFHLITVAGERPLAQAREQIRTQLTRQRSQSEFDEVFLGLIKRAKIEVNPKYGRFSKDEANLGVIPPDAPQLAPTTTAPATPGLVPPP